MNITHAGTVILGLALTTSALAESWKQDARVLSCSPATLRPGGTLELRLGRGHGRELSVTRESDQKTFFLVVKAPPADTPQLMTTSDFARATAARIPASFQAKPEEANARQQRVFSSSGSYSVGVSENLESETGGYICRIYFNGAAK